MMNMLLGGQEVDNGVFLFNCDRVKSMPEIKLELGGTVFTLLPHQYILKVFSHFIKIHSIYVT